MPKSRESGSIWRRWDLHTHTPDTIHADQYEGWEPFLRAIEAQNDVVAIGVTDYLSISNYRRMRREKTAGRIPGVRLLVPNIEFRITPATRHGRGINLHLLVAPDEPDHEERIDQALARLVFPYAGHNYSCTGDQLIALGRAFNPALHDPSPALAEGANQFKVEFVRFQEWFEREGWIKRNSLVAVDAGEQDGAAGLQHDGGFTALRHELYGFADMIFSARPGDRSFWLGQSHNGEAIQRYGRPKPCVHGCDAHSMARLFRPDGNRFCWIKADPSFEGLRQLLHEPAERVWIGETPPDQHDRSRTLQSVAVSGAKGWFDEDPLPLNPGLVSIIGRKGMGKSALNELIAYAGGAWREGDEQSFIHRARPRLKGMRVRLTWGDGRTTEQEILAKGTPTAEAEVCFLSQRFVERLCADPRAGGELAKEIEAVIFTHLAPTETLNASSFENLREKRTATIRQEQKRLIGDLQGFHREIHELYRRALSLPERRARLAALIAEREAVVNQMPQPTTEDEQKVATELAGEREALAAAIAQQAGHKETLLRIENVREKVRAFQVRMDRLWTEISADLREIGVAEALQAAFKPIFTGDVEGPLNDRRNQT
ncbi:MAG TPA: hypothetical protein VMB83_07940 [Roseiarcus sp.]|nr:hypothetical protein [Roseiarcus sp.]